MTHDVHRNNYFYISVLNQIILNGNLVTRYKSPRLAPPVSGIVTSQATAGSRGNPIYPDYYSAPSSRYDLYKLECLESSKNKDEILGHMTLTYLDHV